ncbi:hypothetical protein Clacol_000066 [Clathrus columnatus]|uniref:Uncharacterized protein n=1 Tax=Clathrus columnatus TaxID=1419009 RepID=A0AAV4ZW77_9AGAM|nr:hypothetical protein Clacol_000066 [Clathrus columnatus]
MSSSSKTSDSQNQTSSLPSTSTSNASNGVPQYNFNNFLTNNRETELFQTTQDSFLSSSSQNNNTAVGSGMIDNLTENAASSGSAVSLDLQQFSSVENHAYLSNANPTPSFDGFGLDFLNFIDNNGYNDCLQTFNDPNNDMFFGNQYVPNFDFGSESTSTGNLSSFQANNSSPGLSSAPSQTSTDVNIGTFTDDHLALSNTAEYQSTIMGKAAVRTNVSLDTVTFTSDSSALSSRTDNNAILNAGFSQRSSEQQYLISTAGYGVETAIPNAHWHMGMPSTLKAPYVDNTPGQTEGSENGNPMGIHFTDPNTQLPHNSLPSPTTDHIIDHDENIPTTSTTSPATTRRRYPKKPLPSSTLYTMQNGKYVCQYKGPARPEGCSVKTADVRNLCRHLRNHARKEKKMNIPQEERVACNGVPGESLYLEVSCPFKKEADRGKCRFYRETGTIWKVMTLERWEPVMNSHRAEYHSPDDGS